MGLGEIGHVIAWRILPPHTIAAHSAALSNSRIYWPTHRVILDHNHISSQKHSIPDSTEAMHV